MVEDEERRAQSESSLLKADLVSSIVIFGFGLFVLFSGIYIAFFTTNGTKIWYYSPGMFPIVVGGVLIVLSIIMFFKKVHEGARFTGFSSGMIKQLANSRKVIRLLLAILLFSVYVFGFLGRIPFVVATFLYLFVTMITFRTKGYAVWKLLLISLFTTAIIYVFFGIIAAVPLP